jgi:hypothetical protein
MLSGRVNALNNKEWIDTKYLDELALWKINSQDEDLSDIVS